MKISVVVSHDLSEALERCRNRADGIMHAALAELGDELVGRAAGLAGSGPYGRSFDSVSDGDHTVAGSRSPMASIIERGRKPGRRPPAQSIRKRSGGSFAAAEKAAGRIEKQGTKGRWIVKRARQSMHSDGTFDRVARQALVDIADLKG